jgi:hypothetical protein
VQTAAKPFNPSGFSPQSLRAGRKRFAALQKTDTG